MSNGGMLGLMPRTKRGLVVFFGALFMLSIALQYAAAMAPKSALALTGAVYTSNADGSIINANIYDSKASVYLTGGPCQGGSHLAAGDYYFQVTSPNGVLLSSDAIGERGFTVGANGFIDSTTGGHVVHAVSCAPNDITIQLLPYDDTPNNGGEYKLTIATAASVEACNGFDPESSDFEICNQADQKSDNFKVGPNGDLRIEKSIAGGPAGTEGSFDITVDCGTDGTFHVTVEVPDPGFVVIHDLPDGAECTVDEDIIQEDPPLGYHWNPPTIVGSPATIESGDTVTIKVTNNLVPKPGSIKITKSVEGGPEDFTGSFGITVDCGDQEFSGTIVFPDPGFLQFNGIAIDAECTVTEVSMPAPPPGYEWGDVTYTNNPATVPGGQITEIGVVNHLEVLPPPETPLLTIDKSNDAPGAGVSPPLEVGDTVTYTLDYDVTNGPVDNGIITDVLPDGVTYVAGTASSDTQFTFIDFGITTPGALTWKAATVTTDGTLTYDVTIDPDAADKTQPLVNTACINSDDTEEDCDPSNVFVPPPPLAETAPPKKTAPPTDIAGTGDNSGVSGGSMLLILLALAGIALAVTFVAPTPASIRKRMR